MVKNPQEEWVRSLGWEDPLEEEMTTHSNILAWEIPWTEEPGGLQAMGSQRVGQDRVTKQVLCAELTTGNESPSVMSDSLHMDYAYTVNGNLRPGSWSG